MSLSYDLTKIHDYENVCYIEQERPPSQGGGKGTVMSPVTNAIIHACMVVGIGAISNARIAEEFYARLTIYERMQGTFLQEPYLLAEKLAVVFADNPQDEQWLKRCREIVNEAGVPAFKSPLIEPSDIKQHIGLRANVPHETRTKWIKRIIGDERTGAIATFIRHYRSETKERVAK